MSLRDSIETVLKKYIADSQQLHLAVEGVLAIKSGKTKAQEKLRKALSDSELLDFNSAEMKAAWQAWITYKAETKRDYYLNVESQRRAMTRLLNYDERFSIQLLESAMENQYSGFHFVNTPSQYEHWKRSAVQQISGKEAKFIAALARTVVDSNNE